MVTQWLDITSLEVASRLVKAIFFLAKPTSKGYQFEHKHLDKTIFTKYFTIVEMLSSKQQITIDVNNKFR